MTPRSHSTSRGYTVMEIMMSLAILGLGASGVVSIQKATLLANSNARNLATANFIASTWMERLRVDALQWNAPQGSASDIGDTAWVQLASTSPTWSTWTPIASGSPSADITGSDRLATDPPPVAASAFCTHLRLTQFNPTTLPSFSRLIRAEVRVIWAHAGITINCATVNPADASLRNTFGAVYLTSAVQQNTAP